MHQTFVPARLDEVSRSSGDWIFVDIGFAQRGKRSCGVAFHDGDPFEVQFGDLATEIVRWMSRRRGPFHLLIEAPLSVSFDVEGNPTGRGIERRGSDHRYWYESSGCRTLVAATHLLRQLVCRLPASVSKGRIRLIEGFHSFKTEPSTHADDVALLRDIAWNPRGTRGKIVAPQQLRAKDCDVLSSAFAVSGMDFGVPPVVLVDGGATDS